MADGGNVDMSVQLFAGDSDQRGTSMQYYAGQFDDTENAMDVVNKQHYDWAEIVTVTPSGLVPVTSGIYDTSHRRMIWQHEKVSG